MTKIYLFRQSQTKSLEQSREIQKKIEQGKKRLISTFAGFLTALSKVQFLEGRLGTRLCPLKFRNVPSRLYSRWLYLYLTPVLLRRGSSVRKTPILFTQVCLALLCSFNKDILENVMTR